MRTVSDTLTKAWKSAMYIGDRAASGRVTVQPLRVLLSRTNLGDFTSVPFATGGGAPRELPNVKSIKWDRSVDTDVATCTIEFLNSNPIITGQIPFNSATPATDPGHFSPGRTAEVAAQFGQLTTGWANMLVPDNILRTYQGYGQDLNVAPEVDPHLAQTGMWMIDTVAMSALGATITVTARDIGRKLLDERIDPLICPAEGTRLLYPHLDFPPRFASMDRIPVYKTSRGKPVTLKYDYSSSWDDAPGPNGLIHGHRASDAFDGNPSTYWLSVRNPQPTKGAAFEWIQGKCPKSTISEVRYRAKGKRYMVWLSVQVNGVWQGAKTIPYDPNSWFAGPNGSNIKYSAFAISSATSGAESVIRLPKPISGVTKVRLTFSNLNYFDYPGEWKFRSAMYSMTAYTPTTTVKTGTAEHPDTNYKDYTDIVKLFLAWGGYWWPRNGQQWRTNGALVDMHTPANARDDKYLKNGRIWGDLEQTGTFGPNPIPAEEFMHKPIMEGINYIKSIVGFLGYTDETGGFVWRAPNIYGLGNMVGGKVSQSFVTLDENVLLELNSTLTSKNLREWVFVNNASDDRAAGAKGFVPNPTGLRRTTGWSDSHFASNAEAQVAADMVAIRQMLTYHTCQWKIPGYPGISIDDQVRLRESSTSENYYHYVQGISSTWDSTSNGGAWEYQITSNWLGTSPTKNWLYKPEHVSANTAEYIQWMLAMNGRAVKKK